MTFTEVNFDWVWGKNPVYGAGAECGGQEKKPREGRATQRRIEFGRPVGHASHRYSLYFSLFFSSDVGQPRMDPGRNTQYECAARRGIHVGYAHPGAIAKLAF